MQIELCGLMKTTFKFQSSHFKSLYPFQVIHHSQKVDIRCSNTKVKEEQRQRKNAKQQSTLDLYHPKVCLSDMNVADFQPHENYLVHLKC